MKKNVFFSVKKVYFVLQLSFLVLVTKCCGDEEKNTIYSPQIVLLLFSFFFLQFCCYFEFNHFKIFFNFVLYIVICLVVTLLIFVAKDI